MPSCSSWGLKILICQKMLKDIPLASVKGQGDAKHDDQGHTCK